MTSNDYFNNKKGHAEFNMNVETAKFPESSNHSGHPEHPKHPEHPQQSDKPITIVVNGNDVTLPKGVQRLQYEDVVKLAYNSYSDSSNIIYTVVYSKGPLENKKGTLVKGCSVFVKEGMVFNVGRSDKS